MDSFFALFFRFSFGLFCHALLLPLITPCRFGRRACRWAWLGVSALGSLLAVPLILLVDSVGVLFVLGPRRGGLPRARAHTRAHRDRKSVV